MADTTDLKSVALKGVRVRVPSGVPLKMRKLIIKSDKGSQKITYKGIKYAFILNNNSEILVRRIDQKKPTDDEVNELATYLFLEGFGDDKMD